MNYFWMSGSTSNNLGALVLLDALTSVVFPFQKYTK